MQRVAPHSRPVLVLRAVEHQEDNTLPSRLSGVMEIILLLGVVSLPLFIVSGVLLALMFLKRISIDETPLSELDTVGIR
jgi:hypothetical protein